MQLCSAIGVISPLTNRQRDAERKAAAGKTSLMQELQSNDCFDGGAGGGFTLRRLDVSKRFDIFANAEILPPGSVGHACNCPVNAFQSVNNLEASQISQPR